MAAAVLNYAKSFSIEPGVVLQKSCASVFAALGLEMLSHRAAEEYQETHIEERPEYHEQGFDHNAHGDPTRTHETAVIPLSHLAEDPRAQSGLMDIINKFR